jgi:hypothetical protein
MTKDEVQQLRLSILTPLSQVGGRAINSPEPDSSNVAFEGDLHHGHGR